MKPACLLGVVTFLVAPTGATAQLVQERVEGLQRVCTYARGPIAENIQELRIGVADGCSAYYPASELNREPPPSARLVSASVQGERRICVYRQRQRSWTRSVPVETHCPVAAGMVASN